MNRKEPSIQSSKVESPPKPNELLRGIATLLAASPLLRRGKHHWEANQKNWVLPLTRYQKLWAGIYLILSDYTEGKFPPTFHDQQQAYLNEINARFNLPGIKVDEVTRHEMIKPFWYANPQFQSHFQHFVKLVKICERLQIAPPAKLLELGGGSGWTAEFLSLMGFKVVSTTISPDDVEAGKKRIEAVRVKDVPFELHYVTSPMESVAEEVKNHCPSDTVFVYEALHHAFDWKLAINSAFACLRTGGWFLVCNEPNLLHTAISYRVARLSNTHEVGFSKSALINQLKKTGFQRVISLGKQPHLFVRPHWLAAQK